MYDTICYLGYSAHDFTEISAARKQLTPEVELRFFTAAVELLDVVGSSHATRTLVFLDARALDAGWELVQRLKDVHGEGTVEVALLDIDTGSHREKAREHGVLACLDSPVGAEALRPLLSEK